MLNWNCPSAITDNLHRMKIFRILLCLSSLLCWNVQRAQGVYAQVSAKKVQVGVPFEYAVVMSVNVNNVTPPNFRDFEVVSGPNQSSSVQYANGVMSQQMIVSYGLVAKKEGKFTIGPATVMSGNQKMETQPITIEVVKGSPGPGAGGEQGQGRISNDDLFIRTTVSKSRFYLGEQVTIIQKVYSRHQIIGYHKSVTPAYDGFYSQQLESPTKGQLVMENVDGVNYYTHELFRTSVIASRSGKITLNPLEVTPVIRRPGAKPRNLFEQLLGGAGYEDVPVSVSSRPVSVEVLDLPEDGKPQSFNGAVGNFAAKIELSKQELKANEALTLKVTVTGKGNLKLLAPPVFSLPENFETYEPKVLEGAGSKTFEYLLIPRREGEYTINNIEFSYFNLDTRRYVTIPSPELKVRVLPGDPGSSGAQVYVPQNQVKETENDIRYIKKGEFVLSKREPEFFNSAAHMLLLTMPIGGLAAALLIRRKYVKDRSDIALVRERKAAAMARKQLAKAEMLMKSGKRDEFYTEILTALNNYLGYKLHIPVADMSREKVLKELQSRNINSATAVQLSRQLDDAEFARYAPASASSDLEAVYKDTAAMITSLEQQLNKRAS
jgi:hypothetical protein